MPKQKVVNVSYDLRYSSRDEDHNTIRDFGINFENPDVESLAENINTFLIAVGVPLEVVAKK
jgi:hypothetical protein